MSFLRTVLIPLLLLSSLAVAQQSEEPLTIEITESIQAPLPIAVVPFAAEAFVDVDLAAIIADNLRRSGRLQPLDAARFSERPSRVDQINFDLWRSRSIDYLLLGRATPVGDSVQVEIELVDVLQRSALPLRNPIFSIRRGAIRRLAHLISDEIYLQLVGERGPFSARLAYVASRGRGDYALVVADFDGGNPQTVLRSNEPIMSPSWSPDARQLAYVSFEQRQARIWVHDLYSARRRIVTEFPGLNSAPAWSPDGRRLAASLSLDGNPELYLIELDTGARRRLTFDSGIDTEPSWLPDGSGLVFTSDRGGSPQLYRMSLAGDRPQRLSFEGGYNAAPSMGRQHMVLVHRSNGRFRIAAMPISGGTLRLLSEGGMDESPSLAPGGGLVVFASRRRGRDGLMTVTTDGRALLSLVRTNYDVREPVWSPVVNE